MVRVAPDRQANLDLKDRSDKRDHLVLLDHLDLVELQDRLEHLVTRVQLDQLGPSVLLDSLDRLETLDFQDLGV